MPRVIGRSLAIAAFLTLAACPALPVRADGGPGTPSGDMIFLEARRAFSHQVCPDRIDYTISVEATVAGERERNRFHAHYLVNDDVLSVAALSDEEIRNPVAPHGANIQVTLPFGGELVGLSRALTAAAHPRDVQTELLGIPDLKPTYSFGLAESSAPKPIPAMSSSPALSVIGSTATLSKTYAVARSSPGSSAAGKIYDLILTPLRDPQRNRLRELWVDATTFATDAVRTAGNFTDGPPTRVPWLITFANVDGCSLIAEERALDVLDYGPKRRLEAARIAFTVEPVDRFPVFRLAMPPWYDALKEPDR